MIVPLVGCAKAEVKKTDPPPPPPSTTTKTVIFTLDYDAHGGWPSKLTVIMYSNMIVPDTTPDINIVMKYPGGSETTFTIKMSKGQMMAKSDGHAGKMYGGMDKLKFKMGGKETDTFELDMDFPA